MRDFAGVRPVHMHYVFLARDSEQTFSRAPREFFMSSRCSRLLFAFTLPILALPFQPKARAQQSEPSTPPLLLAAAGTASPALPEAPSSSSAADALPDAPQPVAAEPSAGGFDFRTGRKGDIPLQDEDHPPVTLMRTPVMIGKDLGHIFVSPIYLRKSDLYWILPLAGATVVSFNRDTYTVTQVVSRNPDFYNTAATISDDLRDTYIGIPVALWAGGQLTHNDHVRETGLLGGVAMVDAFVMDEFVKVVSFRERPLQDNGKGDFYIGNSGGLNSSFVSGHSMITWASAAAMAGEYHNPWVQTALYTGATSVSLCRVLGQQHFPTDVLLGGAGGWLIGHYVYRAHHHAPHGKVAATTEAVLDHVSIRPSFSGLGR